ncbi:hypothetical protein GCM10027569_17910 [Flindersiella endophytica]
MAAQPVTAASASAAAQTVAPTRILPDDDPSTTYPSCGPARMGPRNRPLTWLWDWPVSDLTTTVRRGPPRAAYSVSALLAGPFEWYGSSRPNGGMHSEPDLVKSRFPA